MMRFVCFALAATAAFALMTPADAQAGVFGRGRLFQRNTAQNRPTRNVNAQPSASFNQPVNTPQPIPASQSQTVAGETGVTTVNHTANYGTDNTKVTTPNDAFNELNAARTQRGLRPYQFDEGLAQGALACAQFRAMNRIEGHTSNDFAFLPAGVTATAAGCAAMEPSWGWQSCCAWENWQFAGAAWVMGNDERRYMHVFVR